MRRTALFVTASIVALAWSAVARAVDPAPPNILFIMSDDHPWSFYGTMRTLAENPPTGVSPPLQHPRFALPEDFDTPGLNALADRGAFFPVGHAGAAFCHPSFQATLTGLYEKDFLDGRFNRGTSTYYIVEHLNAALDLHNRIKSDTPTVVEYKYRSLGFGKIWTKGSFRNAGFDFGWQGKGEARGTITPVLEFIKASGAVQDAYDTFCATKRSECPPNESTRPDPTQPWFVWYAPNIPHYPVDGRERTRKRVEQPAKCKPGSVTNCIEVPETDTGGADLAEVLGNMKDLDTSEVEGGHINYLSNVLLLDYWVDQLLEYVETHHPNTIIVYQADNGYIFPKSKKANGDNAFRTPIMVSWPGVIDGGAVRRQPVNALDFIPTLVDYATDHTFLHCPAGTSPIGPPPGGGPPMPFPPITGCSAGQYATCGCFEGESMRPLIANASATGRPWLIGMMSDNGSYLRTEDGWRITRSPNCKFRLYDLQADPDENDNCFDNSSATCRGLDFRVQDYAADNCNPSNPACALVKQWQCALKEWRNPGDNCMFSCN